MFVNYESGAFKEVEIHDNYVIKKAKIRDEYDEYLDDDEICIEECYSELEREFNLVNKTKYLGIFPPILEGDETEYKMAKAETFWEDNLRNPKQHILYNKLKQDLNRFVCALNNKHKETTSLNAFRELLTLSAIQMNEGKMSYKTALLNIKKIILVDRFRAVSQDLRIDNVGIYKNKPVLIDGGQTYETPSVRRNIKPFLLKANRPSSKEAKELYLTLLKYKNNKQPITITPNSEYRNEVTGVIVKIRFMFSNHFNVTFDNGKIESFCVEDVITINPNYKRSLLNKKKEYTVKRRHSSRQRIR